MDDLKQRHKMMVSKMLDDYDVLGILGSDINSSYYKVKNKNTNEIFVWKAISIEKCNQNDLNKLTELIRDASSLQDKNVLRIYDCIIYEKKVLYIITEYCHNGNLYEIIRKCCRNEEYLEESFIKYVLHELASIIKRCNINCSLNIKNVFVDREYNIKLMVFRQSAAKSHVIDLCKILHQLTTLKSDDKIYSLTEAPCYYTKPFCKLVNDTLQLKHTDWNVDTLLYHPLLLVKEPFKTHSTKNSNHKYEADVKSENEDNHKLEIRLQNLHAKEMRLKRLEDTLNDREYELSKREKKVALLERLTNEKIRRAEVYLRNASRKSKRDKNQEPSYEKFDTSFSADCGDSTIVPTTAKIYSPTRKGFTHTFSERRIKFKGHSPLKEIHYNYNRKALPNIDVKVKSQKSFRNIIRDKENTEVLSRPISWTEETKRQAFQLLKTLNTDDETGIKHTVM